jgi:uncharacterized protein (TIGR03437 family)
VLYLTGLGAVDNAVSDGAPAPSKEPLARVTGPLAVYIGGQLVPASSILYAGLAPGLASLYQINLQVPQTVPSGNQGLAIQTTEGFTDLVTIPIQ